MAERLIGRDQCARLELDWPQLRGSVIFPPMDSKERLSASNMTMPKDRSISGEETISDLSRAEFAVLMSELDDRIEGLDRSERKWARLKIPAALVVAVTTYVVFAVVGVPGLGLWILTNVLLGLLILFGGQFVRDRQRRSLDQQRAELSALAATPDDDSLLMGTKDPEVGY